MIVYCSDLPNDQDMIRALGSVAIPASLLYGDCAFFGVGNSDEPIRVCLERKKLGDMAKCILDGRYLYQAQRAKEAGMDVLVLVVETGEIRSSPDDGLLEVKNWGYNPITMKRCQVWEPVKPTITYSRFDRYLTELDYLVGIMVKRSSNVAETAAIVKALWSWFQRPPSDHKSLNVIFKQPVPFVQLVTPSLVRRVASELPGIGWGRSGAVAGKFKSVRELVDADVMAWTSIDGIGKKTAEKVVQAIGGGTRWISK